MSNLMHMNINMLGQGVAGVPDPDRLIDGKPHFTTWPLLDEGISTGIWDATPGHHRIIRDQSVIEAFFILKGEIELVEDGIPQPKRFSAGDLVVLRPGFTGSWRTLSLVRKFYCTATI